MATTYDLIVQATDKASGPLAKINGRLKATEKQTKSLGISFRAVGAAITAALTGGALKSIVGITARFEDLEDTLGAVTGSAKKGGEAFKFIQEFATKTQFGVEELTQTYIKLAGAGIKPTEKLLTTFTDTAAITTDQLGSLQAITDLFSRSVSGGLGLEDLNRLADRGVPVFRILEEQLGKTRLELSEFGKTAAGAAAIRAALTKGINDEFGGATQGKIDNLSTAMSNFKIQVGLSAVELGNKFKPQLTAVIEEATTFLKANDKLIQSLGSGLGQAIVATADALKLMAENFEAIKVAVLTLVGLRIASFIGTLASRMSSAIAGAKGLSGIFGGLAKSIGTTIGKIPILGRAFSGLGIMAIRLLPLLTNPFTAVLALIATVVSGGLWFFRDEALKVGGTFTTVGETVRATFNVIGGYIQDIVTYFKEAFGNVWTSIKRWFSVTDFGAAFGTVFQYVVTLTKNVANKMLNLWVVAFEFITGIVYNLPGFFKGAFSAIKALGAELITSLINGFGSLGPAIKQALTGDISGAATTVATAFQADFGAAMKRGFEEAGGTNLMPEVDIKGIMATDRVGQIGEVFKKATGPLMIEIRKFGGKIFSPITGALDDVIADVEAEILRLQSEQKAIADAARVDSQNAASDAKLIALAEQIKQQQLLADELQAQADLEKLIADGQITADTTKLTALESLVKGIKDQRTAFNSLNISVEEQKRLADQLGISYKDFAAALEGAKGGMDIFLTDAQKFNKELEAGFRSAGESLSKSLATSIVQGKGMLSSFKSFFDGILEQMLQKIIQTQIMNPLMNSLFGGGGMMGGGGGILGSVLPMLGGFLGIPGMAQGGAPSTRSPTLIGEQGPELFLPGTTGRVIPNNDLGGGGETTIQFNINSVDSRSGTQFILEQKKQIINMINSAQRQRGKMGIID
tara:strand:- start:8788 stop:11544 length:2757 start_codon:yes stop_codon:yes gene_type:complete